MTAHNLNKNGDLNSVDSDINVGNKDVYSDWIFWRGPNMTTMESSFLSSSYLTRRSRNKDFNSNWMLERGPSMTEGNNNSGVIKGNNDACVSIPCHSQAMTRESRNKDTMPLDTRVKHEYDNKEIVLKYDNEESSSLLSSDNDISSPLSPSDSDTYTLSPLDNNTSSLSPSGERSISPFLSFPCLTRESRSHECRIESGRIPHPVTLRRSETKTRGSTMPQSGRSMVEMLGTLAVIGVLSIGGIAGYSYGMDKYRANQTIHEINLRAADALSQFDNTGDASLDEWNDEQTIYPIKLEDNSIGIQVDQVPDRVCDMIFDELINIATIKINDIKYETQTTNDICGDKNKMVFYFDKCATMKCDICQKCDPDTQSCIQLSYYHDKCTTEEGTGWCLKGECKIDTCESCSDNQFCADSGNSNYDPNPTQCQDLKFKTIILELNGQTQIWKMSLEKMNWWNAKSSCIKMGMDIPSAYELIKNWDGKDRYYSSFNERGKKLFDLIKNEMPNQYVWVQEKRQSGLSYVIQDNGTVIGSLYNGTYAGTVLCR